MFRGHFEHTIDEKGRLSIPARYREALAGLQDERLVVTKFRKGQSRRLHVYPISSWRRLEKKILAKGRFDPSIERFRSVYVAGAHECPIDAQGRILVPPLLREYASLQRDVISTGEIDMFQIWNREVWHNQFADDEKIFDEPETLQALDI
jgi:MraZ protein